MCSVMMSDFEWIFGFVGIQSNCHPKLIREEGASCSSFDFDGK